MGIVQEIFVDINIIPRSIAGIFQEESIELTTAWRDRENKETMDAGKRNLWAIILVYRRRWGSFLVACGLRSYSGVYLGSIPIRGSGAVVAG